MNAAQLTAYYVTFQNQQLVLNGKNTDVCFFFIEIKSVNIK